MTKKPRKRNLEFENVQTLVNLFFKNPDYKTVNWANEIRTARKLFKEFPDMEFWKSLDFGFKINSLVFFLTESGKEILKDADASHKIVIPERKNFDIESKNPLDDEPLDAPSAIKKNTVLDFLKS